jgi:hypothetical protein
VIAPSADGPQGEKAAAELECEIRQGRKFTPEEALARMAGPGAMKGASPVSPVQQAESAIGSWLRSHVHDPTGVLQTVLHRELKGSMILLNSLDQPLTALEKYCRHILASEDRLKELVSAADVEWGRVMDERPFFERDGGAAHPADPYTAASVRRTLGQALEQLTA